MRGNAPSYTPAARGFPPPRLSLSFADGEVLLRPERKARLCRHRQVRQRHLEAEEIKKKYRRSQVKPVLSPRPKDPMRCCVLLLLIRGVCTGRGMRGLAAGPPVVSLHLLLDGAAVLYRIRARAPRAIGIDEHY